MFHGAVPGIKSPNISTVQISEGLNVQSITQYLTFCSGGAKTVLLHPPVFNQGIKIQSGITGPHVSLAL